MSILFQELFTTKNGSRILELIAKVEPRVTNAMLDALNAEFTREGIKAALDHINDVKAPGPNGMPSIIYKKHQHVVGYRIVEEVLDVLNGGDTGRME